MRVHGLGEWLLRVAQRGDERTFDCCSFSSRCCSRIDSIESGCLAGGMSALLLDQRRAQGGASRVIQRARDHE